MKIFLTFIFVVAIATLGVMNGNVQGEEHPTEHPKAEASVADTEAAVVAEAEVAAADAADAEAEAVTAEAAVASTEEHPTAGKHDHEAEHPTSE